MKKEISSIEETQSFVNSLLKDNKYIVDVREKKDTGGYVVQWQEHKTYVSHDGKEFRDEIWLTEAGDLFQVQDLAEAHCRNILRMLLRQDRESLMMTETLTDHLVETYQAGGLITEDPEVPPTIH